MNWPVSLRFTIFALLSFRNDLMSLNCFSRQFFRKILRIIKGELKNFAKLGKCQSGLLPVPKTPS